MKSYFTLLLMLCAAVMPACTQHLEIIEREQKRLRSDYSHVQTELAAMRGELDNMRANFADTRANLQQMQQDLSAIKERVEEVRFQADRQIGRTTREGDQRVKDLESRVAKMDEAIKAQAALLKVREEELKSLREALETGAGGRGGGDSSDFVKEKVTGESEAVKRDYDEAWKFLERKEYRAAIIRFREFLKRHPKSKFADNAQYWIGECYYALKEFDQAILAFDEVERQYPNGDKVPAALLKQGFAFAELASKGDTRFKVDARLILQKLVERYPKSEEAAKAKQKLKTLES